MQGGWFDQLTVFLTILSPYLAVIAASVAAYQIFQFRRQAATLSDVSDSILEVHSSLVPIHESLSTKYLGEFPYFISEITKLIQEAKKSVRIVCDVPGYAFFSDPVGFLSYCNAIEIQAVNEEVPVDITCLDGEHRLKLYDEQFPEAIENWEDQMGQPEFKDQLERFIERHAKDVDIKQLTFEDFKTKVESVQKKLLDENFCLADCCETKAHMAIHFWLVDGDKAIFSIPTSRDVIDEYGFITTDQSLILALEAIRARYLACT